MEESFLTKYKPYYIEDFKLNRYVENALKTFLEMNDLNILIYGSSNSGKTMLLESLVRTYYDLGKEDPLPENNIIYINNLKEQGIQYYRNEMRTFCQTCSIVPGKKKMVVIDDLDNVNEQSQQVFRNYIDNYKHNVHFTMVCTNMQKVIENIQSRMHIIHLHAPSLGNIRNKMEQIIHEEKLQINEECREYLLSICSNSVRIMVNHLEKLYILNEPINIDLCKEVCSNISFQHFENYIDAFSKKDLNKGIAILYGLFKSGYSVIDILDYFFYFIKITPKLNESIKYQMIPYLCKYITMFHNIHEDKIELALFTNSLFQNINTSS
jgi:replication factor C subunit 2/4